MTAERAPFVVEVLQDGEGLYGNAGHELLWHLLALFVPSVPQAWPQKIHHLQSVIGYWV